MTVHHYMVEFEGESGNTEFANENHIYALTLARNLAASVSRDRGSAYIVAFALNANPSGEAVNNTYSAIGHIPYFDGRADAPEGITG